MINSEVHKARDKQTSQLVALKRILMHNEKEGVCIDLVLQSIESDCHRHLGLSTVNIQIPITAIREIKILKQLCHKNIVPLSDIAVERGIETKDAMLFQPIKRERNLQAIRIERKRVAFTWCFLTWITIQLVYQTIPK